MNSENAVPRFARPLTASMNLYSFATNDGATELVAYLAVGAGGLTPASNEPPLAYAFRILLAAGDPVTESIARTDTVVAFSSPTRLPDDATAGTAVPLRVPPADNARITLSVVNGHDGGQGQVLAVSRSIPSVSTTALAMSDIVIAEPRDGAWRRGTHRLAPARGHAIATGAAFRIYSELYNAQRDDPLDVEIVIAPGRDTSLLGRLSELISSRNALAVRFEEAAGPDADGVVRMEREILNQLQAGAYVVMVSVTNTRTGQVARSETNLIVVD